MLWAEDGAFRPGCTPHFRRLLSVLFFWWLWSSRSSRSRFTWLESSYKRISFQRQRQVVRSTPKLYPSTFLPLFSLILQQSCSFGQSHDSVGQTKIVYRCSIMSVWPLLWWSITVWWYLYLSASFTTYATAILQLQSRLIKSWNLIRLSICPRQEMRMVIIWTKSIIMNTRLRRKS